MRGYFFVLCCVFTLVLGQTSIVSFEYPPTATGTVQKLIINVIDTVVVQWTSNHQSPVLFLLCDVDIGDGYNWEDWMIRKVDPTGNASYSPPFDSHVNREWWKDKPFDCRFDLNSDPRVVNRNGNGTEFNGPPLQITSVSRTKGTTYALHMTTSSVASSSSTPASTSAATTTSGVMSTVTVSASPSPSAAVQAASNETLSTGAKAGIAVGSIAGVGAISLIAFFFWRNGRRNNQTNEEDAYGKPAGVHVVPPYSDEEYRHEYNPQAHGPVVELQQDQPPSELLGSLAERKEKPA